MDITSPADQALLVAGFSGGAALQEAIDMPLQHEC